MSRIGKMPIDIPAGVKIEIKGQDISVTGKKGSLSRSVRPEIEVKVEDNQILVSGDENDKKINAFRGLTRSLINNMVVGVSEGFKKVLVIEGVGYRATLEGGTLSLSLGYASPIQYVPPEGVEIKIDGNRVIVSGIDKKTVGEVAAKIRSFREPEPYNAKGVKYAEEVVRRKAGKATA